MHENFIHFKVLFIVHLWKQWKLDPCIWFLVLRPNFSTHIQSISRPRKDIDKFSRQILHSSRLCRILVGRWMKTITTYERPTYFSRIDRFLLQRALFFPLPSIFCFIFVFINWIWNLSRRNQLGIFFIDKSNRMEISSKITF